MTDTDQTMQAIEPLIREEYRTKRAFCERLGISTQVFNNWRQRGVPSNRILQVAEALNLDPYHLQRGRVVRLFGVALERPDYGNTQPGPDTRGLVPLISWVEAGKWNPADDHYYPGEAEEMLPCPVAHSLHTYALRVKGDSMTAPHGRSYPDGSIIYVDPDQTGGVTSGDRVIAKLNGDDMVTFKVFIEDAGRRFLKPLNPTYPVITDPFRLLGKVVGMFIPG